MESNSASRWLNNTSKLWVIRIQFFCVCEFYIKIYMEKVIRKENEEATITHIEFENYNFLI